MKNKDIVELMLEKQDIDFERAKADQELEAAAIALEKQEDSIIPCCGACQPPSSPREGFAPPHEGAPPVKPLFKGNSVSFKGNDAPVGLIPSVMLFEMGRGMKDGAEKHGGPFNWRSGETQKLMYHCNAAIGHILQFIDGENVASDSGISHLAHAADQLAIALDKLKYRTDTDDRPTRS